MHWTFLIFPYVSSVGLGPSFEAKGAIELRFPSYPKETLSISFLGMLLERAVFSYPSQCCHAIPVLSYPYPFFFS